MSQSLHVSHPGREFAAPVVGGHEVAAGPAFDVASPYDAAVVTHGIGATAQTVKEAVDAAYAAKHRMAAMPGYERAERLLSASNSLQQDAENVARLLTLETGKTLAESRIELARAADVIRLSAQEATRIEGRQIPLDASQLGAGKLAVSMRFPVGIVGMIVPFNAPVNLACHKLAPALAAGNTCVLKAPPEAAGTISRLFRHFLDAGFDDGCINLLHGGADIGQALVADPRLDFISFTGSLRAGQSVKAAAGMRPCTLELGGLGPTVIHLDADLDRAVAACVASGFRLAGQSCASVQNVFAHEDVAQHVEQSMAERVRALKAGDPLDPGTDLGPVINLAAADRIAERIKEAIQGGARCLAGGGREGTLIEPTLLAGVPARSRAACEEIFGPVVVIHTYRDVKEVFDWVNESGFGINFGLFTSSIAVALEAHRSVITGAVIVNGTSTFRPDQLPYGGERLSGYGRESPRDSVRAMTRERLIVFQ